MDLAEIILKTSRVVAVVGLSPNPDRPSFEVASYLRGERYTIIPVNPLEKVILGEPCYPNLSSITEPVDVVNIFRRPENVPAVVKEAIKIGAKAIWMQEGVINEEEVARAKGAGMMVIMDRCMLKEHLKLKRRI